MVDREDQQDIRDIQHKLSLEFTTIYISKLLNAYKFTHMINSGQV